MFPMSSQGCGFNFFFQSVVPSWFAVGKVVSVDMNKSPAPEAVVEFSAPMNLRVGGGLPPL